MAALRRIVPVVLALAAATAPLAGAAARWRPLPDAPLQTPSEAVGVWTGAELVVFARIQPKPPSSADAAAAYDPVAHHWRKLAPLKGPSGNYEGRYQAVWTGTEMLVLGPFDFQSFNPRTNRWRRLRAGGGPNALIVWTGRRLIAWGGGCCGDASKTGSSYDPGTNRWRPIAASPLAPSQGPMGAWDGHELIVLVSGLDPDGHAYASGLARAAAYDPRTDRWRRIAKPPATRAGAVGVWDGREVLFVGGIAAHETAPARIGLAYDPATNRWRRLPPMPAGRSRAAAIRAGGRVLVWGGSTSSSAERYSSTGTEFVPAAGRWFTIGTAPVRGRPDPVAVWTGRLLLVWGGRNAADGASWSP
jgi:N-acetylneuraminic acid mutarotase